MLRIALWCLPLFFKPKLMVLSDSEILLCLPFIYLLFKLFSSFHICKEMLEIQYINVRKKKKDSKEKKAPRLFAKWQSS